MRWALAILVPVVLLTGGCGSASDADSTGAASDRESEVAEVIEIKAEGDEIHAEMVTAIRVSKVCGAMVRTAGNRATDAWVEAVETEESKLTDEEREAMREYTSAVRCARGSLGYIRRTGKEIAALTKRLEGFDPAVIDQARSSLAP